MGVNDEDLAVRVRDYARDRCEGDPGDAVSSAWLARELDVDPRTIAAALRPYGVRPAELQRGVRGYQLIQLAGLELGDDGVDARLVVSPPSPLGGAADGVPAVSGSAGTPSAELPDFAMPLSSLLTPTEKTMLEDAGVQVEDLVASINAGEQLPSAVERLSAAAGHDMTGALRAAGLL